MTLAFWISIFIASLVLLIISADRFTKWAEKAGVMMRIPSFIIGVTIVSVGTSLPELLTSIVAVIQSPEASQIVIGNVLGSNVANILLVGGAAAIMAKKMFRVERSLIDLDIPLLALGTALLILMMYDGNINLWEGLILLLGYGVYIKYAIGKQHSKKEMPVEEDAKKGGKKKKGAVLKVVGALVFYGFLIYIAANYTVESLIEISTILNIASAVIATSAVAFGTSLPEFVVSAQAARQGKYGIALGNIFGSNIFNILVVVGVSTWFGTLMVPAVIITIGIPFLIAATLLFVISGITHQFYKYEGAFFLIIYALFIAKLFNIF